MILAFKYFIALVATFGCMVAGIFTGTNGADFLAKYDKNVASVNVYENEFGTALPQTEIYNLISAHFNAELPEGKTVKKAIVIGYDGCRADALSLMTEGKTSAIGYLTENGGHAVLSYCGGVKFPTINKQDTSTAPGWCSMLTGCWADVHGVTGNGIPKSNDHLTLLTTLVENGTINDSAFYVSWGGHFSDSDSTYINERHYIEEKGLDVTLRRAGDDDGTKVNVLADVMQDDCSDFIFSIFEYPDHVGHDTGFNLANDEYVQAFYDAEATGMDVINAIEARDTFEEEDWLILITSDHGGYNNWHGGPTKQERYTFIASNKEIPFEASNGLLDVVC